MKNEEKQPQDTANNDDIPARAIARRRIDAAAIAEIAKLVAKQLTESEACRRLGIQPRAWFNFKDRAGRGAKFAAMLEAYRAHRIEHLINRIEKSADGIDTKFPDFRAALALLKITDQKRFGDHVEVTAPPFPQDNTLALKALELAEKAIEARKKAQVIDVSPAPKQIEA